MSTATTLHQAIRIVHALQMTQAAATTATAVQTLLIDVRSTAEVAKSGMLPCAINIPLAIVADVLDPRGRVDSDTFARTFGTRKPTCTHTRLLLYSTHHTRAAIAADVAREYGYANTSVLEGGDMTLTTPRGPVSSSDVDAIVRAKRTAGAADVHLIDIREAFERRNNGHIDYSLHIPSGELTRAFALRDGAFRTAYAANKPRKDERIVLYDNNNMRVAAAYEFLAAHGYKHVYYVMGGYDAYRQSRNAARNDDL